MLDGIGCMICVGCQGLGFREWGRGGRWLEGNSRFDLTLPARWVKRKYDVGRVRQKVGRILSDSISPACGFHFVPHLILPLNCMMLQRH